MFRGKDELFGHILNSLDPEKTVAPLIAFSYGTRIWDTIAPISSGSSNRICIH
ncbi:hypothetical protein JOD24_000011 [Kroppenstedtia sanguinis]